MPKQASPIRSTTAQAARPERRACLRHATHLEATYSPFGDVMGKSFPATVRDISPCGVCLVVHCRFDHKTILLTLQDAEGRIINKVLRVKYVRAESADQWAIGASFVKKLDQEELDALRLQGILS
jgi:hypothetical protein